MDRKLLNAIKDLYEFETDKNCYSFKHQLFMALGAALPEDFQRLAQAYPAEAQAYTLLKKFKGDSLEFFAEHLS